MLIDAIVVHQKASIHCNGLFTTQFIPKGTLIWTLDGPTYTWKEVKAFTPEKRTFFDCYGFQCGVDRYSFPEDISRYTNHSCNPNTWWSGCESLIARYDILANEEITYDYSTCDIDLIFNITCHCGSPSCRKRITNLDYLEPKWQETYGSHLPPHTLAAIQQSKFNDVKKVFDKL